VITRRYGTSAGTGTTRGSKARAQGQAAHAHAAWDYRPEPAPEGMRRAVVSAGLLDTDTADLFAKDELETG